MPFAQTDPDVTLATLEAIFNALPDSVFLIDPDSSGIVYCNRAAWEGLGYTAASDLLDHSVLTLQKDVLGPAQWESIAAEIRRRAPYVFIGSHRHRRGGEVPVEVHTSCLDLRGRAYFLSVARDITRRTRLESELIARDAQLRFALNEASDGLWDWDIASNVVFFSPQLKRMLGYGPEELAPALSSWTDNIHPDDSALVRRVLDDHLAGDRERYDVEYRLRNRNGHFLWVHDRGKISDRDQDGRPVRMVGMVQNISDRKNLEQRLQKLASHDSLTGLLNRREAEIVLDSQISLCQRLKLPLGVCLFDLDNFKQVNDMYGHLCGDRVLAGVAELFGTHVRRSDHLCRWGGEEFMLICVDTTIEQLQQRVETLRELLAAHPWPDLEQLDRVTASFGIATFPEHGGDARELFIAIDEALYRAKAAGRNRVERPMTDRSDPES
ncbi:diguanylate cyclase [Azoarcus sp. L1K30]|uniref:sensor domain-containing diguanylate cyclase n=1 Tax=Azoarcus sp. L1K30 TaxID=2820277 RepID=UPI001B8420ED|nr:diguanylate cyclase [Azoarcus sp. L1K30]MBR0567543.1 diguanylate cyclase [Azoarcus sp. L1K30]